MRVSVETAARNNAELCHSVFAAHGRRGSWTKHSWHCRERAPRLYPNFVTLAKGDTNVRQSRALLAQFDNDLTEDWAVKDSFDCLDLSLAEFTSLFSATWIARPPSVIPRKPADPAWNLVETPADLELWRKAWDSVDDADSPITPALLAQPEIQFLAARQEGKIVAGCMLNRSIDAIGLSNVFHHPAAPADWLAGCLDEIARRHPASPIVGYESGEMLQLMLASGFTELGPLRVWLHGQ